jgi:hypothetical protein
MGGSQTLNIAIPNLTDYAYIGVFSSGLLAVVAAGEVAAPRRPPMPPPHGRTAPLRRRSARPGSNATSRCSTTPQRRKA